MCGIVLPDMILFRTPEGKIKSKSTKRPSDISPSTSQDPTSDCRRDETSGRNGRNRRANERKEQIN